MSTVVTDLSVKTIDGQDKALSDYAGKVLLIVNVASQCGYTPQYKGLEALYQQYREQGLEVLAFPCNDYGAQEPGSNAEIQQFCETRYGVTFPLFDKVHAKGAEQHPLYARLTQTAPVGDVAWNFEKFLVSKQGEVVGRYKSSVAPDSAELIRAIERELAA
ncbi:MAG: glutathione peroxidase [Leptolyngbyaceae cyanobacterium bins.349]|nr:glutathione peroxidase [Leptolyngbyaceae cyanobacterium bins.349]